MISSRRAIWLVARREILAKVRDKSVIVSAAITLAIVGAIVLLPSLFGGTSDATVAVSPGSAKVAQAATRTGAPFDVKVIVKRVADDAAVQRLVDRGDADAGVLAGGTKIVTNGSAPDGAIPALQAASKALRLRAPEPRPLPVATVDKDASDRKGFAAVALIILYGQLIAYGLWVANGVVEEKTSRIVEILLATIRPRELLAGKVLGIGLVGLGQLLFVAGGGLILAAVSGNVDVGGRELGALPIVLLWFVGGYTLYACAFALVGSTVTRQEDVQTATTPLIMAILAAFFLSFQAVDDPGSGIAQVMSFLPPSAPLVMPVRMIAGDVPLGEVVLSAALLIGAALLVIVVAGRLYGRAVLQSGGRVRLRALLRA
ncbi:MAG: type transport system permease protein [Solirubrobacteraceae bacterium]|nr:type transport system permease protein [Solirubrobacteraceae bacterium]